MIINHILMKHNNPPPSFSNIQSAGGIHFIAALAFSKIAHELVIKGNEKDWKQYALKYIAISAAFSIITAIALTAIIPTIGAEAFLVLAAQMTVFQGLNLAGTLLTNYYNKTGWFEKAAGALAAGGGG